MIRVTPGVGLRLATPLGPARLDVAYNPYKLQAGTLFQVDDAGRADAGARARRLRARPRRPDHLPLRGGAGVLMRRRIARFFFVFVLGTLAMVLGVVTSMTLTPPGRDLLARTVSRVLDRIVLGQVDVGAISGSFLYDLVLQDLVVRDTSGDAAGGPPAGAGGLPAPQPARGPGGAELGAARASDDPAHQAPQRPDELRGGAAAQERRSRAASRR